MVKASKTNENAPGDWAVRLVDKLDNYSRAVRDAIEQATNPPPPEMKTYTSMELLAMEGGCPVEIEEVSAKDEIYSVLEELARSFQGYADENVLPVRAQEKRVSMPSNNSVLCP